jgi:hypothetical protein
MGTYPTLLEQFLREECTPYVRSLICEARTPSRMRHEFEFNRFNLLLDVEAGRVRITDELETSPAGAVDVALDEFWIAIGCTAARS